MRIVKFLGHNAVDFNYKRAFGDDLDVYHVEGKPNTPHDWKYVGINPIRIRDPREAKGKYDVMIYDDPPSIKMFQESGLLATNKLWHCHGFYTPAFAEPSRKFFRDSCAGVPTLFQGVAVEAAVRHWMQGKLGPSLICKRALQPEQFWHETERNGRVFLMGHVLVGKWELYPDAERSKRLFRLLIETFPDKVDVYGYDYRKDIPIANRRGFNPHVTEFRWYSAAAFLSSCPYPDFALMETMAIGVPPVISHKKETMPKSSVATPPYYIELTDGEVVTIVRNLLKNPNRSSEVGLEAQKFIRPRTDPVAWKTRLLRFMNEHFN